LTIVGDSTACPYDKALFKYRGWGQYLRYYLKDNLAIDNEARPGRSTRTFIQEGHWKNILKSKPKFILIQFGTNDAHDAHTDEGVDPEVGYRMFLTHYIDGARKANAIPVLISPAHPRIFDPKHPDKLVDILGSYNETMGEVAKERGAAFVDLYKSSGEFFEKVGPEGCKQFMPVPNDNVHFNDIAAKAMAELVMRRLKVVEPRIVPYLGPTPNLFGGQELSAE
jgi:lysophospholipase L1-like esterase